MYFISMKSASFHDSFFSSVTVVLHPTFHICVFHHIWFYSRL